jgi:tight adherence protein B
VWAPAGAALMSALAGGLLVGLSAALLTATAGSLLRSELRRRRDQRCLTEVLAATRTLAREVRSGAAPVAAVLAGAAAHGGTAARLLQGVAVAMVGVRGADAAVGRGFPGATDVGLTAEVRDRLVRGCSLSVRYGVPWAALIDTVSTDLADRLQAMTQRDAQVTGPRVSGYVMAVLPVLGIVLGIGMGADPVHVLFGTGAGNLLLLVGSALTCAGLAWTARIVRG